MRSLSKRLHGKVSLVTGAGQGIGRAIALAFSKEGAIVFVNDIKPDIASATAKEIQSSGGQAFCVIADVSQREQVEQMFEQVSKIDILINNAGVQTEAPFPELPEDDWQRIVDVNWKGTYICSQLAVRKMIQQGHGKIINVSSIHEQIPRGGIAHYAVSKGGVMMLTKVMALELAKYGITVNCIAPGAIETPMNQALLDSPERLKSLVAKIPLGRMAKPEEIAHCAVFLASNEADYITGSTVYVDGGLSLGQL